MGKFDDFVPTISDSEDDIPDLDTDDDQGTKALEPELLQDDDKKKLKSKKKKKNKKKTNTEEEDEKSSSQNDLNPDFVFDLNDDLGAVAEEGWDFKGDEKKDGPTKIDVDLDSIIRRKGGLGQLAGTEVSSKSDSENDEDDEDDEDDDDGEDQVKDGNHDDDDLAMDGFGMGYKSKALDNHQSEIVKDEDDHSNGEEETPQEEQELNSGNDDGDDISQAKGEEEDEDSPEDIAKFYAPSEEGDDAKKQVHKTFNSLDLSRPVLKGLAALGYTKPSPIQGATIPIALLGKDLIAGAVTGSGKTAAYMIPVIERLLFKPSKIAATRVVVLAPTRELAIQVSDVGRKIGKYVNGLNFGLAVGGLNLRQQEKELKQRPDIVVATPGRFIDHLRNSPSFNVDQVEVLIVDEADRMLEEGFQKELTEILELLPRKRQTLLFSATMNSKIKSLIQLGLNKPVRVMIDPPKQAATGLTQEFVRIRKRDHLKPSILFNILKKFTKDQRIVIFVARKEQAHKLRIVLGLLGLKVSELHGSLTQEQRLNSINGFKNLTVPILICTDLASRGLDIPKIEVVINFDMPKNFEVYLHRVGRTARGGRQGKSISFVGESNADRAIVKESIKSSEENPNNKVNKTIGREVDWKEVEEISKIIESKNDIVEEILEEEKSEKQLLQAEMEVKKTENMMKYKEEIQSRPKRTWFETEKDKKKDKENKKLNSKKRKQNEAREDSDGKRSYKKTQNDRVKDQERAFKKQKPKKK